LNILKDTNIDDIAFPISYLLYFIYLSLAFHQFFKEKYIWSILRAIVYPVLFFAFISKIYILILTYITLYLL
jgi:hypothetical protein